MPLVDGPSVQVTASFFPSLYADCHVESRLSFRELHNFLNANWLPCQAKDSASMVNFASYSNLTALHARDVLYVHALSLDLDTGGVEAIKYAFDRLNAEGLCYSWHTTYRHQMQPDWFKIRIFIPFATPVTGAEYKQIFKRARRYFTKGSDSSVCDPCRRFYRNAYHPDRVSTIASGFAEGSALDPDFVKGAAFETAEVPEGIREVSVEVLKKLAKKWQSAHTPSKIDAGDRLQKVLNGEAFAGEGERNKTAFDLTRGLVETYPDISAKHVSLVFKRSLEIMARMSPSGAITSDELESMVERARESISRSRSIGSSSDRRIEDIRQCFANGRDHAYTQAEISEMSDSLGISIEQLLKCWVLQNNRDYYLIGPGAKIIEACHESLINTSRVILSPSNVETYSPTENGLRLKTTAELLERYSTPIFEVRKSMIAQTAKLDLPNGRLILPVCPLRNLAPIYSKEVDEWLMLFAKSKVQALRNWIHFVPKLEFPLVMLVLIGKGNSGKSLFARGLARLFWEGPETKLADVLGSFNATVEKCPIVFADEHLPKDARGKEPIAQLRELIQSTTRYSNQKHKAQVPVDGALRLIVSANSHKILKIDDELSGDDAPAFAERLFDITLDDYPGAYLNKLGGRSYIDKEWIQNDKLACHFMHLIRETTPQWEGRFGVKQNSTELASKLIVRGGSRAKLCELIVKYFNRKLDFDPNQIRTMQGVTGLRYFVHIDFVSANWDRVMHGNQPLTTYQISQALEGLSLTRADLLGDGARWYEIDLDKVRVWAKETGYAFNVGTS